MFNEELLKKFEFDIRFKYSPVYFEVKDLKSLTILHTMVTDVLKISTNDSYIQYLLEGFRDIVNNNKCDCIFFIDVENKKSDVTSASYFNYQHFRLKHKIQSLPDYVYDI